MTKEDAYPIKTYIDYKLDKLETEEEMKNDPLGFFDRADGHDEGRRKSMVSSAYYGDQNGMEKRRR